MVRVTLSKSRHLSVPCLLFSSVTWGNDSSFLALWLRELDEIKCVKHLEKGLAVETHVQVLASITVIVTTLTSSTLDRWVWPFGALG